MMDDLAPLARIDSFPYRHRIHEVMSAPVLLSSPDTPLIDAIRLMDQARVSSIVAVDDQGRTRGLFTERDLLRLISAEGTRSLESCLGDQMSADVATVPADAFVYVALARMSRIGQRHLVAVDPQGRPVGMVTARALLKVRATEALVLGDTVDCAANADDMGLIVGRLPRLARALLDEGVTARNIAAVIALVLRDMTARSAELAELSLHDDGWGPAPARYAILVLGSAGRGESLLAFDQDNALVHAGRAPDDPWFAELGRRLNQMLAAAGIPLCNGKVMAGESAWRKSLEDWRSEVHRWVYSVENQSVLNCDIFFDFQPVWGDHALAESLRSHAIESAAQSAFFLRYLAQNVAAMDGSLGPFGGFVTLNGRLNLKKFGILPLVSAARLRAIRAHVALTGTDDRFSALHDQGALHPDDLRDFIDVRETLLRVMLEQQLTDVAIGVAPSARVDPKCLPKAMRQRLRWALKRLQTLKFVCGIAG